MTTNRERAEQILFDLMNRDEEVSDAMFGDEYVSYVDALADDGLLRPDLPEPTGTTPDGEATWQLGFDTVIAGVGDVWGGGYMESLGPAEARDLADALYAAADHAEEVGTNGQDD